MPTKAELLSNPTFSEKSIYTQNVEYKYSIARGLFDKTMLNLTIRGVLDFPNLALHNPRINRRFFKISSPGV
jgi:hypothetical protein